MRLYREMPSCIHAEGWVKCAHARRRYSLQVLVSMPVQACRRAASSCIAVLAPAALISNGSQRLHSCCCSYLCNESRCFWLNFSVKLFRFAISFCAIVTLKHTHIHFICSFFLPKMWLLLLWLLLQCNMVKSLRRRFNKEINSVLVCLKLATTNKNKITAKQQQQPQ